MKKIIYMFTILSLCFLGKAQAQNVQWTTEQVSQVQQEIALIAQETPLTNTQKDFLKEILLDKNEALKNGLRVNHSKKVVLDKIEDILRYGMPINRHPGEENIHLATEHLSAILFEEKILDNETLLQALNLLVTKE